MVSAAAPLVPAIHNSVAHPLALNSELSHIGIMTTTGLGDGRGVYYSQPVSATTPAAPNTHNGLTRVKNATTAVTAVISPA